MIGLAKSETPQVLVDNAGRWLSELQQAVAAKDKALIASRKARYNHPQIKQALVQETAGKCAYCEAQVQAVAHGDIEHIFPKSLDIRKTFEWGNLGFSCQICNQHKDNTDPDFENIIDPYNVDPSLFIRFFGGFINSNGTLEGRQTIHHLKLDRAPLTERRQTVMKGLIRSVELIQMARNEQEKAVLIEDFERNELGSALEFSAMRRDFWNAYKPIISNQQCDLA